MLLKRLYIWLASVVCIVAILYAAAYYLHQPIALVPLVPVSDASFIPSTADTSLPVSISIPSIVVNAIVESVGLTKDGAVGVSEGPYNAAWYNQSPIPGEVGIAIIDGHYGWKNNIPAVFDKLNEIKIGDIVYVKNSSGSTTNFVVTKLMVFDEHSSDPSIFISTDGKAHLNLITCGGIWNAAKKSYSDRLVVFTDLSI